jgi:tetratricopeptide (TPR) repeat protein
MQMLEEVIERARTTNNPEAARAFNNIATVHFDRGDFEQARAYWLEGRDFAARVGNETVRRFIEPQLMSVDYDRGHWDEALRAADAFIEECRSTPHYHEGTAHSFRALILVGRDDLDGAAAASARSMALAREIGDPQSLLPDLGVALRVEVERGRREAAVQLAEELLEATRRSTRGLGSIALVRAAEWLGLEDEVRALVDAAPPSRWIDAVRPALDREYEAAADAFGALGDLANEAEFRLRAAEAYAADGRRADADRNLLPALAFFRAAGATRYVRRGEALLAKTA